jgi:hypothetical protein
MRGVAALLSVVMLAASITAGVHADEPSPTDLATAHQAFEEGLAFEDKGDWSSALARFQKTATVRLTPQVRFHLALCMENLGRLVEALNEFRRAGADAAGDSTASGQVVVTNAAKHVTDLKERIPRVRLHIPSDAQLTAISIDGHAVSPSLVDTAMLVDPGIHTLIVRATDRVPFQLKLTLSERGGEQSVEVVLAKAAGDTTTDKPQEPATRGAWPWVAFGLGAATLVTAGVMYRLRANTIDELDPACGANRATCPDNLNGVASNGRTYTTLGNIMLGIGIASVATGVVLLVLPTSERTQAKGVVLRAVATPFSLSLAGNF